MIRTMALPCKENTHWALKHIWESTRLLLEKETACQAVSNATHMCWTGSQLLTRDKDVERGRNTNPSAGNATMILCVFLHFSGIMEPLESCTLGTHSPADSRATIPLHAFSPKTPLSAGSTMVPPSWNSRSLAHSPLTLTHPSLTLAWWKKKTKHQAPTDITD